MLKKDRRVPDEELGESSGPSLILMYCLVAVGILLAMLFAGMVIWPFHLRR